jgi:hypothetical protein
MLVLLNAQEQLHIKFIVTLTFFTVSHLIPFRMSVALSLPQKLQSLKVTTESVAYGLVFRGSQMHILAQRPNSLPKLFFLCSARQTSEEYLKLSHNPFLSHP